MNGLNTRRLFAFAVIILVASIVLLYWFRPVVREVIIIPLSYWAWVIGLFLDSTPQIFFWVGALLIIFMIAWRSFFVKQKVIEAVEKVPDIPPPSGRVSYWVNRVELMRMGSYYQSTFNEALGRLALDLIGYRHRISNRQIERGLVHNTLRLPPEVREFLLKNVFRREFAKISYLTYLYRAIRLWWMSHVNKLRPQRDQLAPEARRLIQYMEEELEVHYDHSGR